MALPDHLFEFIIFDPCNMAGIEVAYELRNKSSIYHGFLCPDSISGIYSLSMRQYFLSVEENADLQRFTRKLFSLLEFDGRR